MRGIAALRRIATLRRVATRRWVATVATLRGVAIAGSWRISTRGRSTVLLRGIVGLGGLLVRDCSLLVCLLHRCGLRVGRGSNSAGHGRRSDASHRAAAQHVYCTSAVRGTNALRVVEHHLVVHLEVAERDTSSADQVVTTALICSDKMDQFHDQTSRLKRTPIVDFEQDSLVDVTVA